MAKTQNYMGGTRKKQCRQGEGHHTFFLDMGNNWILEKTYILSGNPLYGSILLAGTCMILSLSENPEGAECGNMGMDAAQKFDEQGVTVYANAKQKKFVASSCKLQLARFSALPRVQDRAECGKGNELLWGAPHIFFDRGDNWGKKKKYTGRGGHFTRLIVKA